MTMRSSAPPLRTCQGPALSARVRRRVVRRAHALVWSRHACRPSCPSCPPRGRHLSPLCGHGAGPDPGRSLRPPPGAARRTSCRRGDRRGNGVGGDTDADSMSPARAPRRHRSRRELRRRHRPGVPRAGPHTRRSGRVHGAGSLRLPGALHLGRRRPRRGGDRRPGLIRHVRIPQPVLRCLPRPGVLQRRHCGDPHRPPLHRCHGGALRCPSGTELHRPRRRDHRHGEPPGQRSGPGHGHHPRRTRAHRLLLLPFLARPVGHRARLGAGRRWQYRRAQRRQSEHRAGGALR